MPGKGIIGLLWSRLNVWWPSKFSLRDFLSVTYIHLELWYHKAQIRAWQKGHGLLWSSLNVWRPSKFSFRDFLSVTYTHLELWYHKAQIHAWQRSHRASSLNVWLLSNYFYLEVFFYRLYIPVATMDLIEEILAELPDPVPEGQQFTNSMTRSLYQ